MNTMEAAEKLVALLGELGAEGIRVETGAFGVLCLSTDADGYVGHVLPPDVEDTVWKVEML
jgi:hypothetical protein